MFVRRDIPPVGLFVLAVSVVVSLNFSQAEGPGSGEQGYIFPPGKYILGGGAKPARGEDVFEIKKPFRLRPGQFILSGGPSPTDRIMVDDDLEVSSGGKMVFIDDDHTLSTDTRPVYFGNYAGEPIILVLEPQASLRIEAIDHVQAYAELGELYLHRYDGAKRRLTERVKQRSNMVLPHIFFSKEFTLDGFEAAPSITDVLEMPAIPAALLPTGATGKRTGA